MNVVIETGTTGESLQRTAPFSTYPNTDIYAYMLICHSVYVGLRCRRIHDIYF